MNDWVKCSQFVVLTENEEEYYDILGIFPHFAKSDKLDKIGFKIGLFWMYRNP